MNTEQPHLYTYRELREQFNNNSYLVNNNALSYKHTEHISTTEPLYLDGMPGSDNIVHEKSVDSGGDTPSVTKVKLNMPGSTTLFAMGEVVGENFAIIGNENGEFYRVDASGQIQGISEGASEFAETYCKQKLVAAGYDILSTKIEIKSYEVGDIVPDWNAYEKIEMQSQKIAALYYGSGENSLFIIGTLRGEDFEIITNGEYGCTVNINGVLNAYDVDPEYEGDYILGVLQGFGITATSLSKKEVSWEVGSTVPNWSEYTQYK